MRCWIGWHDWRQSRLIADNDTWPMSPTWDRPTRLCRRCGRRQAWLPGYGGSEFGCWMDAEFTTPGSGREPTT